MNLALHQGHLHREYPVLLSENFRQLYMVAA
jgi:hypothetical protein